MKSRLRATPVLLLVFVQAPASGQDQRERAATGTAPYTVAFTHPESELIGDLVSGARGDRTRESTFDAAQWYSDRVRSRYGAWGPPARHYPPTPELDARPVDWRHERLIAAALLFQGYGYQHHHVPDWNPPTDWPWKPTGMGRNGKGVDCSNYTAFVYNLAFGLKTTGDVNEQAERSEFTRSRGGPSLAAQRIELPADYDALTKTLRTGDLLYIKNRQGTVSHVVLWVGAIGRSSDGNPLVLDSHGTADVKDPNGVPISPGVQLRPFRRNSWYFRSASHALRVIRD